jgi:hypothetical protein
MYARTVPRCHGTALCSGTDMTLPRDGSPLAADLRPLVMLDGALQPDPLLRLRDHILERLAEQPHATCWQEALDALDEALAELREVRTRAGLRGADGACRPPHGRPDQRVADRSVAARRRFSRPTD